jgi:hypothetical protein
MSAIFASAITAVVVGAGEYSVLGAIEQSAFRGGRIGWESGNHKTEAGTYQRCS